MANSNKRKGSNAERYYTKVFKEDLGFSFCKTSRNSSRLLDDCGIDLNFLPFNIQVKAGYNKGLDETKTLLYIEEKLKELFPPYDEVHRKPNIIIHKKDKRPGFGKLETREIVFMWKKDFINFIPQSVVFNVVKEGQKRGWSFEEILLEEEYMTYRKNESSDWLVVMTFSTFKKLIKNGSYNNTTESN